MSQMKNKKIDRYRLEAVLNSIVASPVTLKQNLNSSDLLALKHAISPVNNMITAELTGAFIRKLPDLFEDITKEYIEQLIDQNASVNVNANGYDFIDKKNKIVAEIKANIPYEKNKYGASQKEGIKKDINGLLSNKRGKCEDVSDYYKFHVMLQYHKDEYDSVAAIKNFVENHKKKEDDLVLVDKDTVINSTKVIYIIPLSIES